MFKRVLINFFYNIKRNNFDFNQIKALIIDFDIIQYILINISREITQIQKINLMIKIIKKIKIYYLHINIVQFE